MFKFLISQKVSKNQKALIILETYGFSMILRCHGYTNNIYYYTSQYINTGIKSNANIALRLKNAFSWQALLFWEEEEIGIDSHLTRILAAHN